jgi:phosphoribosylformylglycinamidine synthase I
MASPRVLILRAPGTNCDAETAFAFSQAQGRPETVHVNRLLESPQLPRDFQILCVPGGFCYGDDIAAGQILALQIRHHLCACLREFQAAGKLVLGICNGFQALLRSGILLHDDSSGAVATLTWNDTCRYEDRWVALSVDRGPCVFLSGVDQLYLPVAHGEGKFVPRDQRILEMLREQGQLALKYVGAPPDDAGQVPYPYNPNGSIANVAGVCDTSGRVFGLMPHPERYVNRTHHPRWTRGEGAEPGDGMAIFRNAVRYFE